MQIWKVQVKKEFNLGRFLKGTAEEFESLNSDLKLKVKGMSPYGSFKAYFLT